MATCISLVLAFHGVGMTLTVELNGVARRVRTLPVIGEVVDHLLDADRVGLRQIAFLQRAPREGIGRRVDVDREGRDRVFGRRMDRIGLELLDAVAVFFLRRRLVGTAAPAQRSCRSPSASIRQRPGTGRRADLPAGSQAARHVAGLRPWLGATVLIGSAGAMLRAAVADPAREPSSPGLGLRRVLCFASRSVVTSRPSSPSSSAFLSFSGSALAGLRDRLFGALARLLTASPCFRLVSPIFLSGPNANGESSSCSRWCSRRSAGPAARRSPASHTSSCSSSHSRASMPVQ